MAGAILVNLRDALKVPTASLCETIVIFDLVLVRVSSSCVAGTASGSCFRGSAVLQKPRGKSAQNCPKPG